MVCLRYINANTLHKGDNKDDDDDDDDDDNNNNNNNNNNSIVSIARCYELDSLGIEFRLEQHFPQQSRPALEPTRPPEQGVPAHARG